MSDVMQQAPAPVDKGADIPLETLIAQAEGLINQLKSVAAGQMAGQLPGEAPVQQAMITAPPTETHVVKAQSPADVANVTAEPQLGTGTPNIDNGLAEIKKSLNMLTQVVMGRTQQPQPVYQAPVQQADPMTKLIGHFSEIAKSLTTRLNQQETLTGQLLEGIGLTDDFIQKSFATQQIQTGVFQAPAQPGFLPPPQVPVPVNKSNLFNPQQPQAPIATMDNQALVAQVAAEVMKSMGVGVNPNGADMSQSFNANMGVNKNLRSINNFIGQSRR